MKMWKKRVIGAVVGGTTAFLFALATSGGASAAPCVTAEGFPCPPKVISTGPSEPGGGNVGPSEPLEPMGGYTPPPATLEELIAGLIS